MACQSRPRSPIAETTHPRSEVAALILASTLFCEAAAAFKPFDEGVAMRPCVNVAEFGSKLASDEVEIWDGSPS